MKIWISEDNKKITIIDHRLPLGMIQLNVGEQFKKYKIRNGETMLRWKSSEGPEEFLRIYPQKRTIHIRKTFPGEPATTCSVLYGTSDCQQRFNYIEVYWFCLGKEMNENTIHNHRLDESQRRLMEDFIDGLISTVDCG